MSSVVLCCLEGSGRRLLLLLLLCQLLMMSCDAARINRSALMGGDTLRTEVVDPNNRTIWSMFNLTKEQIDRINNNTNPTTNQQTTSSAQGPLLHQVATHRINQIRSIISLAVSKTESSDNQALQAEHEKAGYPICNSETNRSNWQQSSNLTLEFASSVFQQYGNKNVKLDSAILRLYKINPADKASAATTAATATSSSSSSGSGSGSGSGSVPDESTPSCSEPYLESQIRVTVSIVHQQKKKRKLERKKRTCNTIMLSTTKTGWVDIDVKCALTYWAQELQQQQQQQQQQQSQTQSQHQQHSHLPIEVGLLMIEVHDDEENQLLPGLYFQPPTCTQADIAVPWSVYGSATPLPYLEKHKLLKCPRLDVKFLGSGLLRSDSRNFDRLENLQQQLMNPPRIDMEVTTTLNSPTIDNNLELNSEIGSEEREPAHHHRRRHHRHQSVECSGNGSMDSDESYQQSDSQQQMRTHRSHHHHQHQHQHHQASHNHHHGHHHHHHKHRHVMQNEE